MLLVQRLKVYLRAEELLQQRHPIQPKHQHNYKTQSLFNIILSSNKVPVKRRKLEEAPFGNIVIIERVGDIPQKYTY